MPDDSLFSPEAFSTPRPNLFLVILTPVMCLILCTIDVRRGEITFMKEVWLGLEDLCFDDNLEVESSHLNSYKSMIVVDYCRH